MAKKSKPSTYSLPERVNPPRAEVFPTRKSKPSSGRSIPGPEELILLRQKYSWPGRVNPPKAEVFLARKS
jgi:hypothetical protein